MGLQLVSIGFNSIFGLEFTQNKIVEIQYLKVFSLNFKHNIHDNIASSSTLIVVSVLCLDKMVNIWINFEGVPSAFIVLWGYNRRHNQSLFKCHVYRWKTSGFYRLIMIMGH